ncbi:MAG TPA: hypothetical protein VMU50_23545 [Polyangia bacterium]|nr:hypothetical protein [Polyangia bacterium]
MSASRAVVALVLATGCQVLNTPVYFNGPAPLETGGTDDMGNPRPDATGSVVVKYRQPSQHEQQQIDADRQRLGFNVPWLRRDRLHSEILYSVKNLDTATGVFSVSVDGANEFTKYDEGAVAAAFKAQNQDPLALPLMRGGPEMLAPGATTQGTLREDDVVEASLDLYAIGSWMAPFAAVLINRSDVNPVGLEMVPKTAIVPAMFEFDVTFSADKHMTCEFLVRVRDDDDILYQDGDSLFSPQPATYAPMVPPAQP